MTEFHAPDGEVLICGVPNNPGATATRDASVERCTLDDVPSGALIARCMNCGAMWATYNGKSKLLAPAESCFYCRQDQTRQLSASLAGNVHWAAEREWREQSFLNQVPPPNSGPVEILTEPRVEAYVLPDTEDPPNADEGRFDARVPRPGEVPYRIPAPEELTFVPGHRAPSGPEAETLVHIDVLGAKLEALLRAMELADGSYPYEFVPAGCDKTWIAQARMQLQIGLMCARRAVVQGSW